METFIVRRFGTMLFVLVGVSMLTYGMMFVAPSDPATQILKSQLGQEPSPEQVRHFREEHGLNDPLPVQYGRWAWNVLHGDLGESYIGDRPVSSMIVDRAPQTIELAVAGMLVALLVAVPTGIVSAVHKGQLPDYLSQIGALLGLSIPNFWLGYLLIMLFAVHLHLLPVAGAGGLDQLLMPAVTMGTALAAINTRLLRSSMLEVLDEEYIATARSKGLTERIVVYKHAVRNALIPILTIVGLQFGYLLNGAVIVEVVFNRQGLGALLVRALKNRNYPVVQGMVLLIAVTFVVINFLVDVTYRYLDPRIELDGREP